ncbi:hypothetical protein KCP91_12060 [Microvirga sp. SRT01]|uniref:Phage tail protein n=1 Tax=Sphingomonas longa TaxID=2778730 RepID=A0ABS2D844_9SPHN|nr:MULTISPECIES: hypothetical protein [Alphaproteobacteria]MBM6577107.1 hypothetical protein [Sphingomonas sp. BT552]MBR7710151.1 hypothetical protein [Microvirga sp. SRT01]
MATGLRIWDDQGRETLSVTDDVGRILGSFAVSAGSSGSTIVAGFSGYIPFALTVASDYGTRPEVAISGTTLSWSYRPNSIYSTAVPATIFYGVY